MKKLLLLCISLFVATAAVQAQDMIVKRNGEEVASKIVEIGDRQIKFRKFSNLTGPVYSVASSEVFFIRFENGTKEVITPDGPSGQAADGRFAHATQAVVKAKAPLRDKHMLWNVRGEFGLSWVGFGSDIDGSLSGMTYGVNVIFDYLPSLTSSSGFWGKLGFQGHALDDGVSEEALNRYDLNLGLGYVVRSRRLGVRLGPYLGIPVATKYMGVDVNEICKVNFGLMADLTWSPGNFDLGVGYNYSLTNSFDVAGTTAHLNSVYLTFGYRF